MVQKITTRVLIDGVECYAGDVDSKSKAWDQGQPVALEPLSFTWGRNSIVDQPEASTCTFGLHQHITGDPDQVTLFGFVKAGAVIQVRSTAADTGRDVIVWAGSITTADVTQTGDLELEAAITATDPSTIIGNVDVGDEPWPKEDAVDRFNHITAAAGVKTAPFVPGGGWSWQLAGTIDPTIQTPQIAARDVDAQPPLGLLQDLAKSVGGVAWITADESGPVVWIEDPTQRKGLKQFQIDPTTGHVTIGQLSPELRDVNVIPAADIIRDPVTWTQDPTQAIKIVQVNWQQPGIDQDGNPTVNTRVAQAYETGASTPAVLTVDTELAAEGDANLLAFHWLAISATGTWLISGMSIDTACLNRPLPGADDAARLDRIMDLLDVRIRIGYRITVTNLPAWNPGGGIQSYHVEGGTYTWSAGRWQLEITASSNAIGGGAKFNEFPPGVKISDFSGLKGRDAWGVAPPSLSAAIFPFTFPVRF